MFVLCRSWHASLERVVCIWVSFGQLERSLCQRKFNRYGWCITNVMQVTEKHNQYKRFREEYEAARKVTKRSCTSCASWFHDILVRSLKHFVHLWPLGLQGRMFFSLSRNSFTWSLPQPWFSVSLVLTTCSLRLLVFSRRKKTGALKPWEGKWFH